MKDNPAKRTIAEMKDLKAVEKPAGVFRTTLSFNEQSMSCHIALNRGSVIPLHNHEAVQHGYVLRGRLKFLLNEGRSFVASEGSSYVFDPWEHHGAEALEDTEVIEFFAPMRPEYVDN